MSTQEEESDSGVEEIEESQSSSPLRRSSRIRRMSSQSSNSSNSDTDDEDEDSDQDNNNNNNNNRNRNIRNRNNRNRNNNNNDDDDESDVVFDENKNCVDEEEGDSSTDDEEEDDNDELEKETHPDFSLVFPSFINKSGGIIDKYNKIDEDIHDTILSRLVDTAQSLAEYNHQQNDYKDQTQKLQDTMNKLLNLSKNIKIEQLMYSRIATNIRNNGLKDDMNGEWETYLDAEREKVSTEIETGNNMDGDSAEINRTFKEKMLEYKQQFDEATEIDPIQEYDSDDEHGGNHNNNNRNNNGDIDDIDDNHNDADIDDIDDDEDDDDDDIIISAKNVNVGSIKCPLTMKIFRKPIKSKVCGHTFEKDTIYAYIEDKNKTNELSNCPLPGCEKILSKDQFIRDVKIEKLIKAQSKQNKDDDSDDDGMFDLTLANQ